MMRRKELMLYTLTFEKHSIQFPMLVFYNKLHHFGIRGHALDWIIDSLVTEDKRVILRNGASSCQNATSGVQQGSVLWPVLFLLFVNDIPDMISSTAKMFADDTKLYCQIMTKADCDNLQSDLNALSAWSKLWLQEFNAQRSVSQWF